MDSASSANGRVCAILEKVKSTFAFNGFDGASMQDLAQAAQMSVGNFYRYFPSKTALVTALVKRDLEEIEGKFETVKTAEDPGATYMQLLRERVENMPFEDAALWSEVHSAANRVPEIAELMSRLEETVRRSVTGALARIHGDDSEEAMADYITRADFTMLLVHGFAERKFCGGDTATTKQTDALAQLVLATLHDIIFTPPASASKTTD